MEVESKTKKCPYRSTARRMFYLGVVPSQDVQPAGFLVCHGCVERPRGRWLIAPFNVHHLSPVTRTEAKQKKQEQAFGKSHRLIYPFRDHEIGLENTSNGRTSS